MNQERQNNIYQKDVLDDAYKGGDKVWLFPPDWTKSRKFSLPCDVSNTIMVKISDLNYKIAINLNTGKWHIVHYKRPKPIKGADQHQKLTRPSTGRLRPTNKLYEEDDEDRPHQPNHDDRPNHFNIG